MSEPAKPPVGGAVGEYIAIEWHDGPLLEIAPVDFPDRDRLVQVHAVLTTIEGEPPWQWVTTRFRRAELQAMLDVIDGKPVLDFHDVEHQTKPANAPATRPRCRDFVPALFRFHWREWHRGHGCELDDGEPQSEEVAAAIAEHDKAGK